MKIALITEKYPPDFGGLAISVERLASLLLLAGHEPQVFAPSSDQLPGIRESIERRGIIVHRFGERRRLDDTLADWFDLIVSENRQASFDLLHAYFINRAGFVAVFGGGYLGIPSVVSARGNDLDRAIFDPGKTAHMLFALHNASAITANTRDLAHKAKALAPGRAVAYIPNGVDGSQIYPLPRDKALAKQLGLGGESVIGFVGEARAKKGIADSLIAFQMVASQRPPTFLLVGGVRSGEDQDLVSVFQKQNSHLHLVVIPSVPMETIPKYYSLIDVLIMPSLRDGLPNALLEGMACERAVVATPVGGIPEAVRDGKNGRLVPARDPRALADAILELLGDPGLRQRLGNEARATILEEFTPDQELEKNLAIYRQLIS